MKRKSCRFCDLHIRRILLLLLATSLIFEQKMSAAKETRPGSSPSYSKLRDKINELQSGNVGGGEINENPNHSPLLFTEEDSESNFHPSSILAHELHASLGLERYPNYLSRWNYNLQDIDRLEQQLREKLSHIREQKKKIYDKRDKMRNLVHEAIFDHTKGNNKEIDDLRSILEPPSTWEEVETNILHETTSKYLFRSAFFSSSRAPTVEDVINGNSRVNLGAHTLEHFMTQEMFDVYSLPLLSEKFCKRVLSFLSVILLHANKDTKYDSIGKNILDLDSLGLGWLNSLLFHLIISPISQHLFHKSEIDPLGLSRQSTTSKSEDVLDWRQGYIIGYAPQNEVSSRNATSRSNLVSHTDDSEVTLNINLGEPGFVGGELNFYNLRGEEEGIFLGSYKPKIGYALIHSGRHLHQVTPLKEGKRFSFIIWARSWKYSRSYTCPCCWMNRRRGRCICAPR